MGLDMGISIRKKRSRNSEEVAYWRKANSIHNYFVTKVIKNEDYCGEDYKLTKKDLEDLYNIVIKVLDNIELIDGKVHNGDFYNGFKFVPNYEEGKVIKDSTICKELLPTVSGFFFGSTDYDEFYYDDLVHTKKILEKILNEVDFDKYHVYYWASW